MDLKVLFGDKKPKDEDVHGSEGDKNQSLEDMMKDTVDAKGLKDVHPRGVTEAQVAASIERLIEESKENVQVRIDAFHEELAKAADGKTEDMIPLNHNYWKARDRFQSYLHTLKGE